MGIERSGHMAETVRRAYRDSGSSLKRLAEASGTPYASVHGFFTGQRDVTLNTLERWCRVLGLRLVRGKRRKG